MVIYCKSFIFANNSLRTLYSKCSKSQIRFRTFQMEYATFRFIGTLQTFQTFQTFQTLQTRNSERRTRNAECLFWTINPSILFFALNPSNLIQSYSSLASTSGNVSSLYHRCFNSLSGMFHIIYWYDTSLVRSTNNYSMNLKRSRRLKQGSNKVRLTLEGWI